MEKFCYILNKDCEHVSDADSDASVLHNSYKDNRIEIKMLDIDDFDMPNKLYCQADFRIITETDYPVINPDIPVFSIKMLNILKGIGEFKYTEIPVIMLDDTFGGEIFVAKDILNPEIPYMDKFRAIQIKTHTSVFDYDKSIYRKSLIFPEKAGTIEKVVLKLPKEGFPPLFKIKEDTGLHFVNSKAKEALESANIKGCVFEPVEVSG